MTELTILEKKLAEKNIVLPENPFWSAFRSFGLDELFAAGINVIGTAGMDVFLKNSAKEWSKTGKDLAITFTGPVIEKFGFFPQHFYEAAQEHKHTSPAERKKFSTCMKKAFREGGWSLLKDLAIHDPIYAGMLYTGLRFTLVPAPILAALSFGIAVAAVAGLEVKVTEKLYDRYQQKLQRDGFGRERYFEARFFVRDDAHSETLLEKIAREFSLPEHQQGEYHDRYFANRLYSFSGRTAKLRLRRRIIAQENREVKSAQIIYTRVSELAKKKREQHRYFPAEKEKFYFLLDQEMPERFEEVHDIKARARLVRALHRDEPEATDFTFSRTLVCNPALLATTDRVYRQEARPFYLLELKVRKDTELLKEAMRYVMIEFPVLQTTYGKLDLSRMNGKT